MRLMLIKKDRIYELVLPKKKHGIYYLEDKDQKGNDRNLISIEPLNESWKVVSNSDAQILNGNQNSLDYTFLENYNFYNIYISNDKEMALLYCSPFFDNTQIVYKIKNNGTYLIGNDNTNQIIYKTTMISKNHAKITYNNSFWEIESLDPKKCVYVNGIPIIKQKLSTGDVVFILGLKLMIVGNNIIINNPNNLVECSKDFFEPFQRQINIEQKKDNILEDNQNEVSLFEEEDYFFRAPRFKTVLEKKTIQIDSPPVKEKQEEIPMIYTLGPMLTMGLTSMVTGITTLSNILTKKQSLSSGLPSLVIAVAMLMTMMLWPLLSKAYQKKKKKEREILRRKKYSEYIDEKRQKILTTIATQRQIFIENRISLEECKKIIENKKRNLWERKIEQDDFLNLRLGIGTVDALVDVVIPEQHFTLEEDDLKNLLTKLDLDTKLMRDVPISVSFVEKNISAIIGNPDLTNKFINGLILQLIALHSYEDLKLVIFTNKENEKKWKSLKILPHCFSDDKQVRFFATDINEYNQLSNYLSEVYFNRKNIEDNNSKNLNYKNFSPYYLILTDDFSSIKNLEIITNVLNQNINLGFSLIINNKRLLGLPNECSLFINIDKNSSGLFENELIENKQKLFVADIDYELNIEYFSKIVANIPINFEKSKYQLPNCLTFLEMYNVGRVEQLNSLVRWKNNNPITSLQAPVGIGENGDLFRLDIHEKAHGPHGLVAGMTGSGKSEFLISYILSMAVNYSPYEVSFVIIDYKGGGLAGAFENKETGLRLPHIAGTITNLDVNDMKRALASIDSELKLRQKKFNEAREALNESTIDIYKYQKLYRNGQVKEPIPHLIIISDEFAELKTQQPEFMDKLISTARIGRSLGVHLILATQKPSGVVNDQIWSNSKFRVCLKVQDKTDSNDMIKRPEAANIKNVGRFFLQVGYNEYFALGQSAWAGATYYKMDKRKKKIDNNIDFIDNVGEIVKSVDIDRRNNLLLPQGEELSNIVVYLSNLAKEENISINKLWLNKIPELIFIDDLRIKYNYQVEKFNINPIIGEYDVPNKQEQHILTLPLSKEGNTIIYGASGSGKELVLSDIIYSTIKDHGADEVNFYVLDFGAETLKMYNNAPQIGDILTSLDTEKIENLFKLLKTSINMRKKLFLNYNGNYEFYCKNSGKTLPTIICIINNYEAFLETYPNYEEEIIKLTREGVKYGIIFVFTVSTTNAIRYKLRQNFKQEICLQLNDALDYNVILGNVNKLYPNKLYGRGLIKLDNVYEFQTAHPYFREETLEQIQKLCLNIKNNSKFSAVKIPILPKKIGLEEVKEKISNLNSVPIGIEKNYLKTSLYDFKKNCVNLVTSRNDENFENFIPTFVNVLLNIPNLHTIVFDAKKIIKDFNAKYSYINSNFDLYFEQLSKYFEELIKNKNNDQYLNNIRETIIVIVGFDEYKNRLSADNQKQLIKIFEEAKQVNKLFFVLVDSINKLKRYELESWYRSSVSNTDGIWLGNGFSEQYLIKTSITPKFVREKHPLGFGFKIKDGTPILIKYLCDFELEEELSE